MSKFQLFTALSAPCGQEYTIRTADGKTVRGIVLGVEREDGSGSSFNVRICTAPNVVRTVYVRTID